MRTPNDIIGIWLSQDDVYRVFGDDNRVKKFFIDFQDNQYIGKWAYDEVYYYEPGYNLVIYITDEYEATVYELVDLNEDNFTWCPVDKLNMEDLEGIDGTEGIGKIIGQIINKAQEGYDLNPELYMSFKRVSEDKFMDVLDSLDLILQPWEYDDDL